MYTENEVLQFVKEEDVKFVRLAFFSLNGKQKNISIMANELPRAFKNGVSFDASSIQGFQTPDKSDLFLHPDPATITILPWRPSSGKVVRMFCDIKYPDGTPYEKDCRHLLKTAVKKAKDDFGVQFMFGSEVEFYLFNLDENGEPTKTPFDNAGYMDIAPEDKGENIRREICFTLEAMGIRPEASHHEEGPGQNEIDFHYADAVSSADNTATFKWIVRTKANASGLFADFSPKPLSSNSGSGLHINISCHKSDSTKAHDSSAATSLHVITNSIATTEPTTNTIDYTDNILAGILKHIAEITLFLNPTANSYERLGKFKAPKYISWGKQNRSELIRIPASKEEKRLELRSPDPEANPYLAFTLLIYSALDGIKNNLLPPPPVEVDLFTLPEKDILSKATQTAVTTTTPETTTIPTVIQNLRTLPTTIADAKREAASSTFVKSVLGEELLSAFIE